MTTKLSCAYYLSHNGLGDNILAIGALRFLQKYYEKIYFLCVNVHKDNVRRLIGPNIIIIAFEPQHEILSCMHILNQAPGYADIYVSGACFTPYLSSRIRHPEITSRVKDDKDYASRFPYFTQRADPDYWFLKDFYHCNNLDLSVCFEYFDIDSSEKSLELLNLASPFKIVFCHTKSSDGELDLSAELKDYRHNDDYIIINPNKNTYYKDEKHFSVAESYINQIVGDYIDVVKNASHIYVVNSSFASIVLPLLVTDRLKTKDVKIIMRTQPAGS